ncbi:MAG: XdhC family protein [Novosphingobium sp.]
MATSQTALTFLQDAARRGERTALIVLTAVEGGAARGVGTLMAVSEAGPWCGSLSGGCTEAALAGEARRVIANGRAESLRVGAGSPLIDIRLPCGSAIDLLILPQPDGTAVAGALALLASRVPVCLEAGHDGALRARSASPADGTEPCPGHFAVRIDPQLRLVIAGHGEEVQALTRQARAWGAAVLVLTPDEHLAGEPDTILLKSQTAEVDPALDPWSAMVFLFHDHDWEVPLLTRALAQPFLWIGAMGSRATHARRIAALAAAGVTETAAAPIHGPIGLIPSARDPETLALSVLAEVVSAYKQRGFP